ncbi:MAG TPA: PQQ-binding-like beta-propeller repeat protein [Tepidisphaeraceae bacterium]|nr:PQQ-binding-like beta-propeller repeat protein [Tepidisphaeraceae bacterium]
MHNSRWLTALFIILLSTSALAIDWPQWRGPNRDNLSTETGLLKQWPKEGPPLLWKATGLGIGYSTVSVVGDRIYTMGDSSDSSYVRCISLADGKPIWSTKVGKPGGDHPGTRCTPTVDGDMVYVLGQFGDLVAVTAADGKEVWRKSMKNDFAGKMMSGWGYAESPLVDGDKVLVTPGGNGGAIVALNKKDGGEIWRSKEFTDSAAYSSLVPAEIGGLKQYVQITGNSVVGIAPDSGKVLWKAPRKGKTAVVPTPIIKDDLVFVSSGYGVGCNLFQITKTGDSFSAKELYANTEMANHHGGLVLLGDYIYGHSDSQGWTCMELKTGKTMWKSGKLGKGSIAYADGHLYCRAQDGPGTIALIEATPTGWKETGRFDQPDRSRDNSWPQPVISNGKLFIRDHDTLLCYNIKAPN